MPICENCSEPLSQCLLVDQHPYSLPTVGLEIVLENACIARCPGCFRLNVLRGENEDWDLVGAILREMSDWPMPLTGRQFGWIKNWMILYAGKYRSFAEWLDFANFQIISDYNLSFGHINANKSDNWVEEDKRSSEIILFKEVAYLYAVKLGLKNANEMLALEELLHLPKPIDGKVKHAMKMLPDDRKFPSRTEFINDQYICFINTESSVLLTGSKINFSKGPIWAKETLEEINILLKQAGYRRISWRKFLKMKSNGFELANIINKNQKIIGSAFCRFEKDERAVYISYCVIDQHYHRSRPIREMFRAMVAFGDNKGAKIIFLEPPKQLVIGEMAENLGFIKVGKYYFANI